MYISSINEYKDHNGLKEAFDRAKAMNLRMEASSPQSIEMIEDLSSLLKAQGRERKRPRQTRKDAVAATVADLLVAQETDIDPFSYRLMENGSFTGHHVGSRPFKSVLRGLHGLGFVEVHKGFKPTSRADGVEGYATRIRATAALFEYLLKFGITPRNWQAHFKSRKRPKAVSKPVILKSMKTQYTHAHTMPFDADDATVKRIFKIIEEINEFFCNIEISPDNHMGFQRIFALGDDIGFNWNKGGRLYSIGGGYQQMKREQRPFILLGGEKTVEIDIRASHLTILHGLLNVPPGPGDDPYAIPNIDRDVVKAIVNAALGYGKFHTRWPDSVKIGGDSVSGEELELMQPYGELKEVVMETLPVIPLWLDSGLGWADLQFEESEIVIGAVHKLAMEHGVPALPVHDSIIVPESKQELAMQVLSEAFEVQTGIKPTLTLKGAPKACQASEDRLFSGAHWESTGEKFGLAA